MTTGRKQAGCHPDSPFAMPARFLTSAPSVIPAQAGIQWFNYDMPARAGMTAPVIPASLNTAGCPGPGVNGCRILRGRTAWPACSCHSRTAGMDYVNHWIPACAGMTEGAIDPVRQPLCALPFSSSLHCSLFAQAGAGMTTGVSFWILQKIRDATAAVTGCRLRRHDGGAEVRNLLGIVKRLSRWQPTCFLPVVIPAQAGIQWFNHVMPAPFRRACQHY